MSRNTKGFIGFSLISLVMFFLLSIIYSYNIFYAVTGFIFIEIIMISREIYQSENNRVHIEWDDILRYTIAILLGGLSYYIGFKLIKSVF